MVAEFGRIGKLIEPAPKPRRFTVAGSLAQSGNVHIGLSGVFSIAVHEFPDPLI
jgi:hypothetical protein